MKGELPAINDGIVQRTVCFHLDGNKCYVSAEILVKRCVGFYSYKLKPIHFYGRYCTVDQQNEGAHTNSLFMNVMNECLI